MYQHYIYTIIFILYFFSQEVLANYCDKDITCHPPYKCCEIRKGCCYDQVLHSHRHFRLQIWNLWYFWFLIIFMMMSCFGGCGYYRRRRLAILTRSSTNDNRPLTLIPTQHRVYRGHPFRGREFNLLAFNSSSSHNANPMPVTNLPPSYAEIVEHPNMYPSAKIDLPPYTATEKPEESHGSMLANRSDVSMPPPYSECPPPSSAGDSTHVNIQGSNVQGVQSNTNSH